MKAINHVINDF